MGFKEVKSELVKLEKADLIKHISELYKKYKPVREYFDFFANPDEEKLLEKYKEKVKEGFFPVRGYNLRLSVSRKAISDFKKLGATPESVADTINIGWGFHDALGDIYDEYYG